MLAKIRLPRFFSYQFFKNAKIGVFNTAASIQPNPFWFWEKFTIYSYIKIGIPNTRIFDDSKYSIFDDRISNHRIGVKYSNIEPILYSIGSNIR